MKYGNAETKYHNKKIRHGDEVFDSQHELHRWLELILLQRAGKITDLFVTIMAGDISNASCGSSVTVRQRTFG